MTNQAQYYRTDNTTGYSQTELDLLNEELERILNTEACNSESTLTPDEVDGIIKNHADWVAAHTNMPTDSWHVRGSRGSRSAHTEQIHPQGANP